MLILKYLLLVCIFPLSVVGTLEVLLLGIRLLKELFYSSDDYEFPPVGSQTVEIYILLVLL